MLTCETAVAHGHERVLSERQGSLSAAGALLREEQQDLVASAVEQQAPSTACRRRCWASAR